MKIVLFILCILNLVSCGDRSRIDSEHEEYFLPEGWRLNRFVYNTGSKVSRHIKMTIPSSEGSTINVTIQIPSYDSSLRNYCLGGRILSLDYSRFLSDQKYDVIDCYQYNGEYRAEIRFYDMSEQVVEFDFQGY